MKSLRERNWRPLIVAVIALVVVIAGSMLLVRYQNRGRALTQVLTWAVEDLRAVPDSVVTVTFPAGAYRAAMDRFEAEIRTGALPVDSIRVFYANYALWARDGIITPDELAEFGTYLGLPRMTVRPDTTVVSGGEAPR